MYDIKKEPNRWLISKMINICILIICSFLSYYSYADVNEMVEVKPKALSKARFLNQFLKMTVDDLRNNPYLEATWMDELDMDREAINEMYTVFSGYNDAYKRLKAERINETCLTYEGTNGRGNDAKKARDVLVSTLAGGAKLVDDTIYRVRANVSEMLASVLEQQLDQVQNNSFGMQVSTSAKVRAGGFGPPVEETVYFDNLCGDS